MATDRERGVEPSIADIGAQVRDDLSQLREAAGRRREELISQVRSLVDEHPIASLGAAFGAGYLLSGALFSRLTARVVSMGARWYLGRVVRVALGTQGAAGGEHA